MAGVLAPPDTGRTLHPHSSISSTRLSGTIGNIGTTGLERMRDAMAKSETQEEESTDPDSLPTWKRQSVERSLQSARARAQDRSDRFVNAGIELIKSTGDTGFTVQEVVDESGMSIRTFYLFFASKDDLLLAIHESIMSSEVEPRLRRRCDDESDPIDKIKTFIDALFELSGNLVPSTRAFIVQQHRLAEARPDDLDVAVEPQVNLFIELLSEAADAGRVREGLDVETTARLLHHLILSVVEARVLGSKQSADISPDQVWDLCATTIGVVPAAKVRARA
jgi:AcrR family transcriptional regulator